MNQSQQANARPSGSQGAAPVDYGREVVVRRVVAAPRDLVFRVWTDPVHLARWWGPHGFTNPRCEADARPGGKIHIDMRAPDGTVYPMAGEFKEVVPPERLVFTSGALDGRGALLFENLNTVTFAEERDGTAITVRARCVMWTEQAVQYLAGMEMGWVQTIERAAAYAESVVADAASGTAF